jgi:SSS family solute:Na+ symporter/sodium/pantothenate symporter
MGGTYAHAYTNTLQGIMMLLIALFLFVYGLRYFDGGFMASLSSIGQKYASVYNSDSNLYFSFFSVFLSGFIVTFALMLQPHILTKVLYLRSEKDIGKFIGTTVIVGGCFSLMLMLGFYARLSGVEVGTQDAVVREYLLFEFGQSLWGEYLLTFIFITLLAAGMSTLDGILVSLSAVVVNDLVSPLLGEKANALVWSRWVLIAVGIIGLLLAWNPPPLIGLFAQKGVYGLAAASTVPILFGVLSQQKLPIWLVSLAAILGLFIHLVLNLLVGVVNPAVSAAYAIIAVSFFSAVMLLVIKFKAGFSAK